MTAEATTVTCACGRAKAVALPGTTITLHCTFCPPKKPKPTLRLVK